MSTETLTGTGLHLNTHVAPSPILRAATDGQHSRRSDHELNNLRTDIFVSRIPGLNDTVMATANDDEESVDTRMKCCCGRPDCVYLEHNHAALGGLERDLETAARLGQALLSRHESYISESQAERERLSACIMELESERVSLQNANEKIVAENRELLQQLERLNSSLADSDRDVQRLEGLLFDCELEVKRLNGLVRRTEELDVRVQEMEHERQQLSRQMEDGKEETRSTLSRWRESERRVRELEEEVRRIEWEARLDREKHEEIVARLEKERSLERELGSAEGRLKGATAVQSIGKSGDGSKNVVSHFVRDILQDNANLQAGIAELRQLLQSSNEEVQNLREQVLLHQPIAEDESEDSVRRSVSLDQELPAEVPSPKQREVHVHHHYHAKLGKTRTPIAKRPSKRRAVMPLQGNVSDSSMPPTPLTRPYRYPSSPVAPLNLYQQQPQKNRWSMQSTATGSSVLSSIPSSPRSYFDRGNFLFDRIDQGEESSRPTSPESVADFTPLAPSQWKPTMDVPILRSHSEDGQPNETFDMSPVVERKEPVESTPSRRFEFDPGPGEIEQDLTPKPSILLRPPTETDEVDNGKEVLTNVPEEVWDDTEERQAPEASSTSIVDNIPEIRPSLNRKGSHETLVSISGMDIHIPQRASSGTTLELLHRHFAHSPSQTRKISAAQPLASVTEYTVVTTPASVSNSSSNQGLRHMPSSIEVLSGIAVPKPRAERTASQNGAIGRLGGWVRDRWGATPVKSSNSLRSVSSDTDSVMSSPAPSVSESSTNTGKTTNATMTAVASATEVEASTNQRPIPVPDAASKNALHAKVDPNILFAGRSPGVNQRGFIPGFREAVMNRRTPSQIMASVIDEEGLREGLEE